MRRVIIWTVCTAVKSLFYGACLGLFVGGCSNVNRLMLWYVK